MWKMLGNLRRNALGNIFSVLPRVIGENSNFGNMRLRRSTETKCEADENLVERMKCLLRVGHNTPIHSTRIAVPTDYDFVLNFMCDTYFKSEPSMVNIGLANRDPSPVLIDLMLKQIKDGMTIITLNEEGCIIGAAVNTGMCPWDPAKLRDIANCIDDKDVVNLLRFFAKLAEIPDLWNTYDTTKIFECSCVAVDPQYRGVGIASKLIQDSWKLARDCGCRLFRIDCSSKYTAKIAQKLDWQCVTSIPYSSHVECDELVFKNIRKPHDTVDVYIDFPSKAKPST